MTDTDSFTTALESAVLEVPGVAELFRPRPTVGAVVTAAHRAVRDRTVPNGPRVVLDGDTVRLVIGTDASRPSPDTVRAVRGAVRRRATEAGLTVTAVDVRVARIAL